MRREGFPTFTCISSHHRGDRQTPWNRGADDGAELKHLLGPRRFAAYVSSRQDWGWCDDCWCKTLKGYVNKRVRDFKRHKRHPKIRVQEGNVGRPVQSVREYREMMWNRGTWIPERKLRNPGRK